MNEQNVDKIQSTAMGLLLFEQLTLTEYRDFAYQVIELCKDYAELRTERDGLKDQVYDLLSLRHGSSMLRCSAVVPQEAE